MSNSQQIREFIRLYLIVVLVILSMTYVIVKYLHSVNERTVTFETYDDAEARKFMLECDGHVRVHTRALKHWLRCYKKKEQDDESSDN